MVDLLVDMSGGIVGDEEVAWWWDRRSGSARKGHIGFVGIVEERSCHFGCKGRL